MAGVKPIARKKIGKEELVKRLAAHERFLKKQAGGVRLQANFCVLPRSDIFDRDLAEAELVGADLTECDFSRSNLSRANLFGANLTNACLTDANMTRVDLRGAVLKGANLEGANLMRADIRDGFLVTANENGEYDYSVVLTQKSTIDNAKFAGANLGEAKLGRVMGQTTDLTNCNLRGANLAGADLSNSNLSGVVFTGADLSDANLSGCRLNGAVLVGAVLAGANLDGADLCACHFVIAELEKCDLSRAVLPRTLADIGMSFGDMVVSHNDWLRTGGHAGASGRDRRRRSRAHRMAGRHAVGRQAPARHDGRRQAAVGTLRHGESRRLDAGRVRAVEHLDARGQSRQGGHRRRDPARRGFLAVAAVGLGRHQVARAPARHPGQQDGFPRREPQGSRHDRILAARCRFPRGGSLGVRAWSIAT